MKPFNERLKELRRERGLTQEALARAAGMSVSAVSKLEQHDMDPSWSTVQQLAGGLQVSVLAFVEGDWLFTFIGGGEPLRRHFESAGVRLPKPRKAPAAAQDTPEKGKATSAPSGQEKPATGQPRKRQGKE